MSPIALLKTRRLGPLVLAQSCGALNDNLVKNAMVVLAIFQLQFGGAGLSALAGALFIAPYALLSATAGKLADRFAKPRLIRLYKLLEVGLMALAGLAFLSGNVPALLGVLVGLGLQATLFGPVKYGVLPELLAEDELIAGNGLIEATTFLCIVIGTVAGGALILLDRGTALVGAVGFLLALLGLFGAMRIPQAAPADPSLRIRWNLLTETRDLLRLAYGQHGIWLCILGLSWFWTVGATLLTEFPVIARDTLHGDGSVMTLLLSVFAIGVGTGSIFCAKLLHGEVSPRFVPFAALGISLFCWDFARATQAAGELANAASVVGSLQGWRIGLDLFLLAGCGGIFSVPLYAIIQDGARPAERSRMVAANNVMNAVFMVLGSGAAAAMAWFGFNAPHVLVVTAAANLLVAFWIVRILPHEVYRSLFRWFFRTFHGVTVRGLENYRAAGSRVVIVSNHQSYFDACLIAAFLPDSPTFAVDTGQFKKWWAKPFLNAVDTFPVDAQSPYTLKRMIEAVRDHDRKLMIFPEGRLTRTGALMKVYEGAGLVADKAHARILPISIDGPRFSHLGKVASRIHRRWFPALTVNIWPSVDLTPVNAETLTPRERRMAIGRALQDVMVDAVFRSQNIDRTLFGAILEAAHTHGKSTIIAEDTARTPITYRRLILGAVAVGRALAQEVPEGGRIGLLLPNAVGSVVTFAGLQAFGRIPCLLNPSAGASNVLATCQTATIGTVVSSRDFIQRGKLSRLVEQMAEQVRFVWLEDIRAGIGLREKVRAKLDALLPHRLPGAHADPGSPAVVLFTSGSEGNPKGVALSHRNILANCAQLASVIDFHGGDIVFNAMPMFHSFGLTGGTILPLVSGVRTFHYPSPLHYRIIPALIYDTDATICFGTDTFLNGWARYAHPYDFYAMRYIFAGAEKVREETKRLFAERFGVRILEGYGATETAPVIALNTAMHCRPNTVGRLLPGIEHRLEPVPGIEADGRLQVHGPNVMLGYYYSNEPGVLQPTPDGWYDTGDIVSISDAGFVSIMGRAKRFAKIGGEMVSLAAAEALVLSLWPDNQHAVVFVPDSRKGERLILATTRPTADMNALLAHGRGRGVPEIMIPRALLPLPSMPVLSTGKVDYPTVERLAREAEQSMAA
ncbi:MAG TPA: acyl-[ACP]--phospholipid O-acyltransferase [Acetobacteraceae bacterium]|nr:acyl-[ACP]--phospholipid O-acyltransferase [Acetobacteraceae bacterium]